MNEVIAIENHGEKGMEEFWCIRSASSFPLNQSNDDHNPRRFPNSRMNDETYGMPGLRYTY